MESDSTKSELRSKQTNSPSIMLHIDIPKIKEKQKMKQKFLEIIFKQCNDQFQKFHKIQNLNDDQHQKYQGQIKSFLEELKEEIQNAIKFQDENNLTQEIMLRLHFEILNNYFQVINFKKDKIMSYQNNTTQQTTPSSKESKKVSISQPLAYYLTYFKKICSIKYAFIVVVISIIFYGCYNNKLFQEQGKEIQTLQQFNHELLLQQKEQDQVIQKIKQQIDELFEVKEQMHDYGKNKNYRNKLKALAGEIFQNMDVELLNDFTLIYNKYYTQPFSKVMFDKLQKQVLEYNEDPLLCIGSVKITNQKQMILAGCDFASEIFQITHSTKVARLSKNGPIYWYRVENKSFGFAPTEKINLELCDSYEPHNDLRFSYWNDGKQGGRRIGKFQNIIDSDQFQLRIYALI